MFSPINQLNSLGRTIASATSSTVISISHCSVVFLPFLPVLFLLILELLVLCRSLSLPVILGHIVWYKRFRFHNRRWCQKTLATEGWLRGAPFVLTDLHFVGRLMVYELISPMESPCM